MPSRHVRADAGVPFPSARQERDEPTLRLSGLYHRLGMTLRNERIVDHTTGKTREQVRFGRGTRSARFVTSIGSLLERIVMRINIHSFWDISFDSHSNRKG